MSDDALKDLVDLAKAQEKAVEKLSSLSIKLEQESFRVWELSQTLKQLHKDHDPMCTCQPCLVLKRWEVR